MDETKLDFVTYNGFQSLGLTLLASRDTLVFAGTITDLQLTEFMKGLQGRRLKYIQASFTMFELGFVTSFDVYGAHMFQQLASEINTMIQLSQNGIPINQTITNAGGSWSLRIASKGDVQTLAAIDTAVTVNLYYQITFGLEGNPKISTSSRPSFTRKGNSLGFLKREE